MNNSINAAAAMLPFRSTSKINFPTGELSEIASYFLPFQADFLTLDQTFFFPLFSILFHRDGLCIFRENLLRGGTHFLGRRRDRASQQM
jgi:hypothetical protein